MSANAWVFGEDPLDNTMCAVAECIRQVRTKGLCATHYHYEWMAQAKGPIQHGTYSAYQNRECRCDDCKRANTEYQRGLRARRKAKREQGA